MKLFTIDEVKPLYTKHATRDYQNRNGRYPSSGIPDTIDAWHHKWQNTDQMEMAFEFKNTSHESARAWVKQFAEQHKLPYTKLVVGDGDDCDYPGDWTKAVLIYSVA